jgi:hypothetical protein
LETSETRPERHGAVCFACRIPAIVLRSEQRHGAPFAKPRSRVPDGNEAENWNLGSILLYTDLERLPCPRIVFKESSCPPPSGSHSAFKPTHTIHFQRLDKQFTTPQLPSYFKLIHHALNRGRHPHGRYHRDSRELSIQQHEGEEQKLLLGGKQQGLC